MDTRRRHERRGEGGAPAAEDAAEAAGKARARRPTHTRPRRRSGVAAVSAVYRSAAAVVCVGEDGHALRRLPRPHPLPPALFVVVGFL